MLTREELNRALGANNNELKRESCYRSRTTGAIEHENNIIDSHLAALDKIDCLTAQLKQIQAVLAEEERHFWKGEKKC